VFASSISPRGDRSCSLETGHSRGERCDRLHWVENYRRPEGQSTYRPLIPKTHVEGSSTSGESTLGESAGGKFETSEARRAEVIHSC
jgi:hypothetical protein